jgi:hypothetical protein
MSDEIAAEYLSGLVSPLDNFISKDIMTFCSSVTSGQGHVQDGTPYIDLVMRLVGSYVSCSEGDDEDRTMETDCRRSMSLFLSIYHAARDMPVMPFTDK